MKKAVDFTLVELLVVIAVIALLASLLLPALSSAKARGKEMACTSNLRQCSFAMNMYASDFKDVMVVTIYNGSAWGPGGSATWLSILDGTWGIEYLKNYKVVLCPSFAPDAYKSNAFGRIYGGVISPSGAGVFVPAGYATTDSTMINITQVPSPSTLPVLGDSICHWNIDSTWTQSYMIRKSPTTPNFGNLHIRHFLGANIVFVDGHVKNVKRTEARQDYGITKGVTETCDLIDF